MRTNNTWKSLNYRTPGEWLDWKFGRFYSHIQHGIYNVAMFVAKVKYAVGLLCVTAQDIRAMRALARVNADRDLRAQLDQAKFRAELQAAYDKGTFVGLTPITLDPDYTAHTRVR